LRNKRKRTPILGVKTFDNQIKGELMRKPIVFLAAVLCLSLACVFLIGWPQVKAKIKAPGAAITSTQPQTSPQIDNDLIYWHILRHVALLNKKADEVERQGAAGGQYRSYYKSAAHLNDETADKLTRVALDTFSQMQALEARAKVIIDDIRANNPGGNLKNGEKPPAPNEELKQMQAEREKLIAQSVRRLREDLGYRDFEYFESWVNTKIRPTVKGITPESVLKMANQPPQLRGGAK
jgi:hypothetical protein